MDRVRALRICSRALRQWLFDIPFYVLVGVWWYVCPHPFQESNIPLPLYRSMHIKIYRDLREKEPFVERLASLKDSTTQRRIRRRLRRVEYGDLGDYRSVGEGGYELRLHFGPGCLLLYGDLGA